ncbi:hypothetical protein BB559_000580 [Furculomyces boomerangus]|uniref:Uncharacterized protein n=1 Tax=Furculomyces boomerangus TaxID=61424 RepID=A0A2T9Z4T1_9FUNG|nr:hypothetical protein BB559_000580 [Furculomyces boomerangus]
MDVSILSTEKGANIHAQYDGALRVASGNENLDITKYISETSDDIYGYYGNSLESVSKYEEIVDEKYLCRDRFRY